MYKTTYPLTPIHEIIEKLGGAEKRDNWEKISKEKKIPFEIAITLQGAISMIKGYEEDPKKQSAHLAKLAQIELGKKDNCYLTLVCKIADHVFEFADFDDADFPGYERALCLQKMKYTTAEEINAIMSKNGKEIFRDKEYFKRFINGNYLPGKELNDKLLMFLQLIGHGWYGEYSDVRTGYCSRIAHGNGVIGFHGGEGNVSSGKLRADPKVIYWFGNEKHAYPTIRYSIESETQKSDKIITGGELDDKRPSPQVLRDMKPHFGSTKWQNMENEDIAAVLLRFAKERGSWNDFTAKELNTFHRGFHNAAFGRARQNGYPKHGLDNDIDILTNKDGTYSFTNKYVEEVMKLCGLKSYNPIKL